MIGGLAPTFKRDRSGATVAPERHGAAGQSVTALGEAEAVFADGIAHGLVVVAAQVAAKPEPISFRLGGGVEGWVIGVEPRQDFSHGEFFFHIKIRCR